MRTFPNPSYNDDNTKILDLLRYWYVFSDQPVIKTFLFKFKLSISLTNFFFKTPSPTKSNLYF